MGCESEEAPLPERVKVGADSSPTSSTESNFRELDDAFLQTQTRIWLGEVLQIRLDEQHDISQVLADGELLFQVSLVVWRLLLTGNLELRHKIAYKNQPFASKKNSGRYRPYSNVDSFLKICKILGLTGIDLFSPSDVVEKRNTRSVCMCVRSLSRKARSKNLNVPDFDVVTDTVAMPKDMVGYIRRNLELSQTKLADSPSYYLQKHAGRKLRLGYSITSSPRNCDTYSEDSDDTEISHPVFQFDGLATDFLYDDKSQINPNLKDLQMSPMVNSIIWSEDFSQSDIQSKQRNDNCDLDLFYEQNSALNVHHSGSSFGSNSTPGTIEYGRRQFDIGESMKVSCAAGMNCWSGAALKLEDQFDEENNFQIQSFELCSEKKSLWNKIRQGYKPQDIMKYEALTDGIPSDAGYLYSGEEFEESEPSLYYSDSSLHQTNSNQALSHSSDMFLTHLKLFQRHDDRKSPMDSKGLYNVGYDQFEGPLSWQSYSLPDLCKWDQKGKCAMNLNGVDDHNSPSSFPEDGLHEKITSYTQHEASKDLSFVSDDDEVVDSVAVTLLDVDGKQLTISCEDASSNVVDVDGHEKCLTMGDDASDFQDPGGVIHDIGERRKVLDMITNDASSCQHNDVGSVNCDDDVSDTGSCLTNECLNLECNDAHQACQCDTDLVYHHLEDKNEAQSQEEEKPKEDVMSVDCSSDKIMQAGTEIPKGKPGKKLLLKSVLGGTAVFGLVFMLLNFRRNGREKAAQSINAASNIGKDDVERYSSQKVRRKSKTEGVYPAEKLG